MSFVQLTRRIFLAAAFGLILGASPSTAFVTQAIAAGAAPPSLAPMLARVSPGVVNISIKGTVKVAQNPLFQDPLFRQFFIIPDQPSVEHIQAVGSGVIFDAAQGYVLTNNHVIAHADSIIVTLKDGRQLRGKLVGTDPQTDVAVVKIPAENLTAVPLGSADHLQVGDYVVAIGDPFGVGQTATFGIVSALGRTGLGIEGYEDFIQTDASINPGNSGGALVDMDGRIIGINTAILSRSGGNVGIGFAIPINMARAVAQQLIEHGKVERGRLGVALQDLTPAIASAMNLELQGGAIVARVTVGSSAEKAGLKSGDVIVALNEQPVRDASQVRNFIGLATPGSSVTMTIVRGKERRNLTAELEPAGKSEPETAALESSPLAGASFGAIPQDNPLYGNIAGVYVRAVDPGSPAENVGLQPGDILVSADRTPVHNVEELRAVLRAHSGKPLLLGIQRGDSSLFIAIR